MALERSDKAYEYWRDAALRFDYFVTGVSGALTAYVGQSLKPHRIGLNPQSLELIALLVLVASVVVGLKRIEAGVDLFRVMHANLFHNEARGKLIESASKGGVFINTSTGDMISAAEMIQTADLHRKEADETLSARNLRVEEATRYYKIRNYLLLGGFLLLIVARIIPAYT